MAWYPRSRVQELPTVDDLEELIQVMEREDLSEFIYLKDGDSWLPVLR